MGLQSDVNKMTTLVFSELVSFYRERFGADAQRALTMRDLRMVWPNLVDAVCIANGPEIEQAVLRLEYADGNSGSIPGFVSCLGEPRFGSTSVGRFRMYLLWRLSDWKAAEAATKTLQSPGAIAEPGVCTFGATGDRVTKIRFWGTDTNPEKLWAPDPPLWRDGSASG